MSHDHFANTPVRKHARWMAQPDDRILELLRAYGPRRASELRAELAATGEDLYYPQVYVDKRCEILTDAGLLCRESGPLAYEVTDLGVRYLDGGFDAATISRTAQPRPGRVE